MADAHLLTLNRYHRNAYYLLVQYDQAKVYHKDICLSLECIMVLRIKFPSMALILSSSTHNHENVTIPQCIDDMNPRKNMISY